MEAKEISDSSVSLLPEVYSSSSKISTAANLKNKYSKSSAQTKKTHHPGPKMGNNEQKKMKGPQKTKSKDVITVIIYETLNVQGDYKPFDSVELSRAKYFYRQVLQARGFVPIHVGGNSTWEGWGSKIQHVLAVLDSMDSDQPVIVTDARDVLLNPHYMGQAGEFFKKFKSLTAGMSSEAVVFSTENQCCVSALTHVLPGDLVSRDVNGSQVGRPGRACTSGGNQDSSCRHLGSHLQLPWEEALAQLAHDKDGGSLAEAFPYPNAGLMMGLAGPLRRLWHDLRVEPWEDDQAVISDAALQLGPRRVILDYNQVLFGNNAWAQGQKKGCLYEVDENGGFHPRVDSFLLLTGSRQKKEAPAFLHFSGQFWSCYAQLASQLPKVPTQAVLLDHRRLGGQERVQRARDSNYGYSRPRQPRQDQGGRGGRTKSRERNSESQVRERDIANRDSSSSQGQQQIPVYTPSTREVDSTSTGRQDERSSSQSSSGLSSQGGQ